MRRALIWALIVWPTFALASPLRGVNVAGAEFGSIATTRATQTPFGVPGRHYVWPSDKTLRYWTDQIRVSSIRLPFRWERVQPELGGSLDPGALSELKRIASTVTGRGVTLILDMHNFGNRWVRTTSEGVKQGQIDGPSRLVTRGDFADVWGKLASAFGENQLVHFDLMNEPHGMKAADGVPEAEQVARFYQSAITSIRAAGAKNTIHIEPPNWAKPATLIGTFSSHALGLYDPENRLVFHVHQYLDNGENGDEVSLINEDEGAGEKKLTRVTEWARINNKRLFLGEFGLPARGGASHLAASTRMIAHIEANSDVWAGWTAWAAGPLWKPDYPFLLEPIHGGDESAGAIIIKRYTSPQGR